jgi:hypothetical protein
VTALQEALLTLKATAPEYFKKATDHTIRGRLILKILQQSGNIMFNVKSDRMIWPIEIREPKVRVMSGGQRHTWTQTDGIENLFIDHAELEATDVLERRQQQINSDSPNALVDLAGTKMDRLVRTMTRKLNSQFFVDNSGANSGMMTGIKSFMNPAALTAGDLVAVPAAGTTYGGKSIVLGELGGQWSTNLSPAFPNTAAGTDWPEGSGSSEYDYNTPKMINTNATFNGSQYWKNNCLKVMRRMNSYLRNTGGEGSAPPVHLLASRLYDEALDKLEERERTSISDYAKSLGFPDVIQYGGGLLVADYDCPADEGYAINPNEIALYSVNEQLFFTDSDWSTFDQISGFLVGFLGNWVWTPKYTGAYLAL